MFFGKVLEEFRERVKIIHIVRDGRDVVLSRHPVDTARHWISPSRWVEDVSAGLSFEGHPQVLTIRYEDLVKEYDITIRCRAPA